MSTKIPPPAPDTDRHVPHETPVLESLEAHRTVRRFDGRTVPDTVVDRLIAAALRTATSLGLQQCSVIRVTDPEILGELAAISGQDYLKESPLFFVYLVDIYRNESLLREKEIPSLAAADMNAFFQGFTDACLMAQSMNVAAESLGLGACFFGSILNDPGRVIRALKLPRLTFPVLGHGIGYPAEMPPKQPRMPAELRCFENHYKVLPDYHQALQDYDRTLQTYRDARFPDRAEGFSARVARFLDRPNLKRAAVLQFIRDQGFHVDENLAIPRDRLEG